MASEAKQSRGRRENFADRALPLLDCFASLAMTLLGGAMHHPKSRSGAIRAIGLPAIFVIAWPLAVLPAVAAGELPSYAIAFSRAFEPGFTVTAEDERLAFQVVDLGRLTLPSGRLVACDVLVQPERPPFAVALPRGRFPVRLATTTSKRLGTRTIFARLDVKAAPVARWAMALIPGQEIKTLKLDYRFGYPVDAGTGAFLDAETARALVADKGGYQTIVDAWVPEKREGVLYPYKDANVAIFHSGLGDGFYTTWLGYDSVGDVAAVVTDFEVIDWDKAKW